jgi:hypothetical protein
MTPRQKEDVNKGFSVLHQWMTIIGFPVLLYLVGDMYSDFKKVRDSNIQQDQRIQYLEKQTDKHDNAITTLSQYVFRGK